MHIAVPRLCTGLPTDFPPIIRFFVHESLILAIYNVSALLRIGKLWGGACAWRPRPHFVTYSS